MDVAGDLEICDQACWADIREQSGRYLTRTELDTAHGHESVHGEALVIRSEMRTDRNGRPFVALMLQGTDGTTFEARWWRYPYSSEQRPAQGSVYLFTGTVDTYRGSRQFSVTDARELVDRDMAVYVRTAVRPFSELLADLRGLIGGLEPDLAALVETVLSGETLERYCTWPAAHVKHGAVRHGLLAHSVRVVTIAKHLSQAYAGYEVVADMGIVAAACLLHDVGKVHTLPAIAGATPPPEAEQFDHVTLGALMVRAAAERIQPPMADSRLNALLHALLAHHGRKEWGSPIEPQTAEAWLVHLADLAESRLWAWSAEAPAM